MNKLLEAAKDVIARWDSPQWKWDTHTGVYIDALRQAVQDAEVYTPMTDDESDAITKAQWGQYALLIAHRACNRSVERAVIERLGLRWPTTEENK